MIEPIITKLSVERISPDLPLTTLDKLRFWVFKLSSWVILILALLIINCGSNRVLDQKPHYELVSFLFDNNYIDQHPKDDLNKEYATFYATEILRSHVDLIWYSDFLIR